MKRHRVTPREEATGKEKNGTEWFEVVMEEEGLKPPIRKRKKKIKRARRLRIRQMKKRGA